MTKGATFINRRTQSLRLVFLLLEQAAEILRKLLLRIFRGAVDLFGRALRLLRDLVAHGAHLGAKILHCPIHVHRE